jgi:dolichyl-phosphate beta-glucosyltransferase
MEFHVLLEVAKRELDRVGLQYKAEEPPEISVIIPAYNEDKRLASTLLEACKFLDSCRPAYEIIVVDDGSRDATALLVRQFQRINPKVHLICLGKNQGKGAAVRLGMNNARGEVVIYLDADGSSRIDHMTKLIHAIKEGADVAIGSRIGTKTEKTNVERYWYRHLVGQCFNILVRTLAVSGFNDTQCGFKMFRLPVAKTLFKAQKINGFAFDVEILYLCRKFGFHVAEIPIDWTHKSGSKVSIMKDSLLMLADVCRIYLLHVFIAAKDKEYTEPINCEMVPGYGSFDNRNQ